MCCVGNFACGFEDTAAVFPGLQIEGFGILSLPLPPDQARSLKMYASPLPMVEERRLYGILQYVAHGSLTQPSSPFTILVLQPLRIKLSLKDQRHVYLRLCFISVWELEVSLQHVQALHI